MPSPADGTLFSKGFVDFSARDHPIYVDESQEGVSVLGTYGIVLVWVLIIIAFGIYWHAMRISQKLNKCLDLLEKLAEGIKK